MGSKITIDSATLANKGLEVIEAHWLYDAEYDAIDVVIHPQSVVHSAVRFVDGSLKAQLGTPDMRLPIQYAMTYPDRQPSPASPPDLVATGRLDFRQPDLARFPALRIAREAGVAGPWASAALIAADDVAVARFLDGSPRLPGHPASARVGRRAVRRRLGRARHRRVDRARRRRARHVRDRPVRRGCLMGIVQPIVTIVLFFLILGTLVVIHELGHFVAARVAGVRVLEFGIGFPPRAKVLRSKGETLYTLNWLPIGGFVKLEGEDGDHANDPRAFSSKSLPVRLFILVSGVVMNVLLAFVIFTGIVWLASPQVGAKFAEVQPDSPAAAAGLQAGDDHRGVDGERFQVFVGPEHRRRPPRECRRDHHAHRARRGRGDARSDRHAPRPVADRRAARRARDRADRVRAMTARRPRTTSPTAIRIGWEQTIRWMGLIIGGLGSLVGAIFTNPTAPPPVSGPIGIATQIGECSSPPARCSRCSSPASCPRNLAVVNILPFPPLDGGRMLMITLKRIFGSRISVRAEQLTYLVGFVFLFAFIIWVSGFDLVRTLGGGPPPPAP